MSDQPQNVSLSRSPSYPGVPLLHDLLSWKRIGAGPALVLLALGACWFIFFDELRAEWQVNAQYSYGYLVPLLTAVLVWCRWPDRPMASRNGHATAVGFISGGLLLFVLPFRLAVEANPEWRLIYWLHGFQVLGLSFCLLYWLGGWPWVRFFSPPLAFALIAVPWPMELEQMVIQGLMRFVAGLTVDVADWIGIPALQDGNLVKIGAGVVGIDEACSGVRSLQSALMLSLFLGEMYRFGLFKRLCLLGGSLLFVLVANLSRTTFLVWAAAHRGFRQMEAWHDAAGLLIMVIVLPSLIGFAYLIRSREAQPSRGSAAPSFFFPPISFWAGLSVIGWLGGTEAATETWYRSHESHLIPNPRWTVHWPEDSSGFKKGKVPENSLAILRCSHSESASWQDEEGNRWSAFFLRWEPGRNSRQLANGHRPEICFPAAGARLVDDLGQVSMQANGIGLSFRHETFESEGLLSHVFYTLWSDYRGFGDKPPLESGAQAGRLRSVLSGERNLGQQVLEIVVRGPDASDDATALLKKQFPFLIRPWLGHPGK
ncbi:MAG: exosortase/archaeosortase family protein [Limisphaerales bacterium]